MKVLFVVFEFGDSVAGGLGRVINGVSRELARTVDLDVLLLCRRPWWLFQLQLYRVAPSGSVEKQGEPVLDTPASFTRLLEQRGGYDVVHFFYANEVMMTSKLHVLERRFPRTRTVFSVHNLFKHEVNVRPCGRSFLRAEEQMLNAVHHIHVLNRAGLRALEQSYPHTLAEKPTSVIYNGLDRASFQVTDASFARELEQRVPHGRRLIACLSRWAPGKGLEHLVAAVGLLLAEGRDVCLALGGRKRWSWEKGSFGYVRRVARALARLGGHGICFGWLREAQRNALFARADVAVMPSELEYFPFGSTEPLFTGVPLVQSRLDCLTELFREEEHCRFFEPRSASDLADQLRVVLDDPAAARRMGERGRARVQRLPTWASVAESYAAMYARMCAPAAGAARAARSVEARGGVDA